MKIYNFEQKSEEWFKVRELKMTASHAQAIGNGKAGLETYITEMMAEHYSTALKENFSSKDTERGNELEEFAREMYELETDNKVEQVGFIEESKYVGCSPDGLVGTDGLTEFKALNDVGHYKLIRDGYKAIDTKYEWQIQMQMLITDRKWCDLVFYNPNFEKSLIIFRRERDSESIELIKQGLEKGKQLIKNQLK
jgi:putative phage-type endonuclease